jgi:hypothetical protein
VWTAISLRKGSKNSEIHQGLPVFEARFSVEMKRVHHHRRPEE